MKLSIILFNMNDVEKYRDYLNTSLLMLNIQDAINWKDDVEIILLNNIGDTVDLEAFPVIKEHIIQINTKPTQKDALEEAINISRGEYIIPMENFSSLKFTHSLYDIIEHVGDGEGISYFSPITFTTPNELPTYRFMAGNILFKSDIENFPYEYVSSVGSMTGYYFALAMKYNPTPVSELLQSHFIVYENCFIEDKNIQMAVSIEMFFAESHAKSTYEKYLNDLIEPMVVLWGNASRLPIKDEAIVRARIASSLSKFPTISAAKLKDVELNLGISSEVANSNFNKFVSSISGRI